MDQEEPLIPIDKTNPAKRIHPIGWLIFVIIVAIFLQVSISLYISKFSYLAIFYGFPVTMAFCVGFLTDSKNAKSAIRMYGSLVFSLMLLALLLTIITLGVLGPTFLIVLAVPAFMVLAYIFGWWLKNAFLKNPKSS